MLNVQRRHRPPCTREEWDQRSCAGKGAKCPILIRGTLNGSRVQLSTAKFLPPEQARDLEAARALALEWERTGVPARQPEYAPVTEPSSKAQVGSDQVEVEKAVAAYMADSRDRGNSESTLQKKGSIFERRMARDPKNREALIPTETTSLLRYCDQKGFRFLYELDLNSVRDWRSTWKVNSLVRQKRQGQVIGFFWFCERAGWLPRNYASDLTRGLGRIQVKATQTGYFQPHEYKAVIDATYVYSDRPSIDKHDSSTLGGDRIRALTELMRWTGLRIRDAVTLERNRLAHDPATGIWSVMVYQKKTGDPVYCPIPPDVAEALRTVPASQKGNTNDKYFFWTGSGLPKTIVSNWQRSYGKLFKLAELKEPGGQPKRSHPHMLRDTFAVESLLAGMRLEEVSTILGHSSVRITEKHYMPWVRARQASLNQSVMESWAKQGKVPLRKSPVVPIRRSGAA